MVSANPLLMFDDSTKLIFEWPSQNCSWKSFSNLVHESIEFGGKVVNHVKAALVREEWKCFTLKFSLFDISPDSVKYLAICSTVDSPDSPPNFVYLGIFHPLGFSVCYIYSNKGEEYVGLWSMVFIPFLAIILSTMVVRLFSTAKSSYRIWSTIWSDSFYRCTNSLGGSTIKFLGGTSTCPWWTISSCIAPMSILPGASSRTSGACRIGNGGAPKKLHKCVNWVINYRFVSADFLLVSTDS